MSMQPVLWLLETLTTRALRSKQDSACTGGNVVVPDLSSLLKKRSRRNLVREALALAAVAPLARAGLRPASARAQEGGVTLPDGRYYDAYVPTTTKEGQYFQYTCEFDAAWVVL